MSTKACYHELTNFKYQLDQDFECPTHITGYDFELSFMKLDLEGNLTVFKGYALDAASGPTWEYT